jgi:hypothetical protein
MRLLVAACWIWGAAMPALGQLAVVQPVLAQFDGGPAVAPGFGFASGESIFFHFDIGGFKPEGDEDLKLKLSWECQVFDAAGAAMTELKKGDVRVDLAPEDKKWRPRVRVELPIPQGVAAGMAEIRIALVDHVAGAKAAHVVPFRTRGIRLDGLEKLQPLRFRFLRAEDSTEALAVAAYRQGDMLWARFEIAGFQTGAGNSLGVSYGLEVFRANGESLYKQDEAASETGRSFYPRRFVQGALSLQLSKDLAPGEYTIALRIRDSIGKQESETKHSFRVE